MSTILAGFVLIVVGILLQAPLARHFYRRVVRSYRGPAYRWMPWLDRVPGVRWFYSDAGQAIMFRVVGIAFIVLGIVWVVRPIGS